MVGGVARNRESVMSDEQGGADKNFRSAYYKSLGVKGSEKSIAHLELLLKAEIFDVKKLKSFCLKHSLTVYYRPLVWKIILSVIPVFTDKDTCSFIKEQKRIEFYDLKHALQVMGRLEHAAGSEGMAGGVAMISEEQSSKSSTLSSTFHQSSSPISHSTLPHSLDPSFPPSSSLHNSHQSSIQRIHQKVRSSSDSSPHLASKLVSDSTTKQKVSQEHRTLSQASHCTPRDFVIIFLLENNRLLSSSVNQMKQEEQVNLIAIAEAFFLLFEEESEDGIYWLFSNFVKKLESYLTSREEMRYSFLQILEDTDCVLLEHIKDLDGLEDAVPIERWICQCYAKDLPESCIESIWDKVISGSSMILIYLAVAILNSFKRKILGFSSAEQLQHLLDDIPKDNFGPIVSKAVDLWELHGSPLVPPNTSTNFNTEDSFSHSYEIEDYS